MVTKAEIRKANKLRRNALSDDEYKKLSQRICKKIIDSSEYLEAKQVFLYASANHEVDLTLLCEDAFSKDKLVAYPKVSGLDMNFHKILNTSELFEGYFGIMEPCGNSEIVLPSEKTLIIVPGLAFSVEGHRIGYGKGFYDRYLSVYPSTISWGVGYDFQIVDAWEYDEFDVPLKGIITEKREVFL